MKVTILFIAALGLANASVILRGHPPVISLSSEQRPEVHRVEDTHSLQSLLKEFISFIPMEQVLDILVKYETDPDVEEVIAYLHSDKFRNLVIKLQGLQELNDFFAWLYDKGIDIYTYANMVLDILGDPQIVPRFPRFRTTKPKSGLTDMVREILSVLPTQDIIDWYNLTCEPYPGFQALMEYLSPRNFIAILHAVKDDESFPEMVQGLKNQGVDTDAVGQFLHDTFGW